MSDVDHGPFVFWADKSPKTKFEEISRKQFCLSDLPASKKSSKKRTTLLLWDFSFQVHSKHVEKLSDFENFTDIYKKKGIYQ